MGFDELVAAAERQPFSGWDFGWLAGRWRDASPGWDYRARVTPLVSEATALLDLDTGGGEFLASLAPLPPTTWATEAYRPNVPIARTRLEPLGARVAAVSSDGPLPFAEESFDLVIDRHGSFDADELRRVLRPAGRFVTQQVGGEHGIELNRLLGAALPEHVGWSPSAAVARLEAAGFSVTVRLEERPMARFLDVGAVVYYLRAIPWQVPEFSVERYRERLLRVHERIGAEGELAVPAHYFYVEATKK